MTITFIQNPPYRVDFTQFLNKAEKNHTKSYQKIFTCFFQALSEAAYETASYASVSFKHLVLGSYDQFHYLDFKTEDFYLIAFKIAIWIPEMFCCLLANTCCLASEKLFPDNKSELAFYNENINMSHLMTKELSLDTRAVPQEIQVEKLLDFFEEINFIKPSELGYMAPLTYKSNGKQYDTKELKEGLTTLIKNIRGRKPFVGTPPAYNTPRLMEFYQQIEDALRLSLYKIFQLEEEFKKKNGSEKEKYTQEQKQAYHNLLEIKNRFILDQAIGGHHCGARYLSEAMDAHYSFYKNDLESQEILQRQGSLRDHLIEILAHERKSIARKRIEIDLGTDAHSLTKYFSNLGKVLALPGTQHVIEHLFDKIDLPLHLENFFKEYTEEKIIETIQEKIKSSQDFREKITDWIQDQVGEWKKEEYEKQLQDLMKEVTSLLTASCESAFYTEMLKDFESLISYLKTQISNLSFSNGSWEEKIEEVFSLKEVKEWYIQKFKLDSDALNANQKMTMGLRINQMKVFCLAKSLDEESNKAIKDFILKDDPLNRKAFTKIFNEKEKIRQIQQKTELTVEQIQRILKDQKNLKTILIDHLELQRRQEFKEALSLENLATEGASPALMEWLLVSQNIFLPSKEIEVTHHE